MIAAARKTDRLVAVSFTLTGPGSRRSALTQIRDRIAANLLEEFGCEPELHGYAGPTIAADQLKVEVEGPGAVAGPDTDRRGAAIAEGVAPSRIERCRRCGSESIHRETEDFGPRLYVCRDCDARSDARSPRTNRANGQARRAGPRSSPIAGFCAGEPCPSSGRPPHRRFARPPLIRLTGAELPRPSLSAFVHRRFALGFASGPVAADPPAGQARRRPLGPQLALDRPKIDDVCHERMFAPRSTDD